MTPNILLIADVGFERPVSGSEQVLHHQINGLARDGLRVHTLTRHNDGGPAASLLSCKTGVRGCFSLPDGSPVGQAGAAVRRPLQLFAAMSRRVRFDAVVAHQPLTLAALKSARKINGLPTIYVFHSPWHLEYAIQHAAGPRLVTWVPMLLRRLLERYGLGFTDQIIVLSQYMRQKLLSLHPVERRRVSIVPGGVDSQRFCGSNTREALKRQLGWPENRVHLLTVRNLEPRMGLDRLVAAAVMLKQRLGSAFYLVIGGSGPQKEELQKRIEQHRLQRHVCLKGFIPAAELPRYYAAADFFILPTRRLEGFGLVTVEALACETPVLGTPVGATVEILSKLDPALLFGSNTAPAMAAGIQTWMDRYRSDAAGYNTLRKACRSFAVTNYTWRDHNRRLAALITESIRAGGRPAACNGAHRRGHASPPPALGAYRTHPKNHPRLSLHALCARASNRTAGDR